MIGKFGRATAGPDTKLHRKDRIVKILLGKDHINFAIEEEARAFAARCNPPGEVERKTHEVVTWGVHAPGRAPHTRNEAYPAHFDDERAILLCKKVIMSHEIKDELLRSYALTLLASIEKRHEDEQRRWKAEMDAEEAAGEQTSST